ncbi:MAG: DUF3048 domain-containing protein [Acidimicrobiales bacterium]
MADVQRALGGRIAVLSMLLGCVALLAPSIASASAITDDQAQLEAREAALIASVDNITATIGELRIERSQLLVDIDGLSAAIEGAADALEVLATARREPAQMRLDLALERFINGDPAGEAFARELQALDVDLSSARQQEVLGSVIADAESRIAEIDNKIRSLATTVPELRTQRADTADRLSAVDAALLELDFELDEAKRELAAVSEDLDWYRSADGRSPLSGRDNPHGNNRPALAIKIDNVPRARPQAGLNDADVVFVELVEGGQTRLAAVFHSEEVASVGPVRSMRTTDVKILQMLNQPLFANSGGNRRTTDIVNASPLVNIGHATSAGGAYFRSNSRPAPHNLFSSTGALRRAGSGLGGAPRDLFEIRRPGTPLPNASDASNGVDVSYRNTSIRYRWNGSGWERTQDGAAFRDNAGVRVAPETVIVQFTPYGVSPADANSPEALATGSGAAWIFTEGRLIEGTWSKPRARNVTEYFDENGDEIQLLPGRIWIELPRPGNATLR